MSVTSATSGSRDQNGRDAGVGSIPWSMPAMLAVVAGVVLFYKLGDCRTLGSHEVYAAVPAREMLHSGNWIVPTFGGLPRLEKPPLSYWIVAGSSRLFGQLNEWTVRLPAATSALLLALLVGVWARRWYGPAAAVAAALVQITSVYVIIFARKAEVDMLLCLFTTAALFLIAEQPLAEQGRKAFLRWLGIYVLLSLSWLAKFHYGPAMVLAPCIVFYLVERRYSSIRHLLNPAGLALFAASVIVWPYLLLQQVPEAIHVWRGETVGRAVGELGREPIWYYVPHVLWLSLPWTPYALAAMPGSWRRAWAAGKTRQTFLGLRLWTDGDSRERFLWIWFLTVFAIVTISASKHKHYIVAALPMLSLLSGQRLAELSHRVRRGEAILTRRWGLILTAVCVASAVGASLAVSHKWPVLRETSQAVSAILGVGGCLIVWLLVFRKAMAASYVAVAAFLGCYIGVNGWILPGRDHRLPRAQFAQDVRSQITTTRPVGVYRMGMNEVVYYLGDPVYRMESLPSVADKLQSNGRMVLVTYEPHIRELSLLGETRIKHFAAATSQTPESRKRPRMALVELDVHAPGLSHSRPRPSGEQESDAQLRYAPRLDRETLTRLDEQLGRLSPEQREHMLDELLDLNPDQIRRVVTLANSGGRAGKPGKPRGATRR